MKQKFYYIDNDGNKKKYVGKIIENNGLYNGVLTKQEKKTSIKDLIYHPEIKEVEGYFSYYSYINSEGKEVKYFDNIKKDEEGNFYFTYTEREIFDIEFHEETQPQEEYYTYIDPKTNEEKLYKGPIVYSKINNTYQGVLAK